MQSLDLWSEEDSANAPVSDKHMDWYYNINRR